MPSVIDGSFEVGVSNPTLPANCRDHRKAARTLVWANLCKVIFQSFRLLVPCSAVAPICSCFGFGVHCHWAPRAVTVKGGPLAIAKRLALDGHEHGGQRYIEPAGAVRRGLQLANRGELAIRRRKRAESLYVVDPGGSKTMMQPYASAAKLRAVGPFYSAA